MKRHSTLFNVGLSIPLILLTACGGSGSTPPANSTPSTTSTSTSSTTSTLTGVFVDSPIIGVGYKTESGSDLTNSLGEFYYIAGETVTFFIGELEFPPVQAKSQVTPLDIAGTDSTDDIEVVNMIRLLQTLDKDGDPDNGIEITPEAIENASAVDFSSSLEEFAALVAELIQNAGLDSPVTELVSAEAAIEHFDSELEVLLSGDKRAILGSWVLKQENGSRNVLTFIDSDRYIIFHEEGDNNGQTAGSGEYGHYSWDLQTNTLEFRLIRESDGPSGLDGDTITATLEGDTLTVNEHEVLTRIISNSNPLIGPWMLNHKDFTEPTVLTFLSDSEYVIVHTDNKERYSDDESAQMLSGEFGTYSLNGTDMSVLGVTVDTDGGSGLVDIESVSEVFPANFPTTLTPYGEFVLVPSDEGPVYFSRIGSFDTSLRFVIDSESNPEDNLNQTDVGSVTLSRIKGFSAEELEDTSWEFNQTTVIEGAPYFRSVYEFSNDGTGYLTFLNADGEEADTSETTWRILAHSGTLEITEMSSYNADIWIHSFVRIEGSQGRVLFSAISSEQAGQLEAIDILTIGAFRQQASSASITPTIALYEDGFTSENLRNVTLYDVWYGRVEDANGDQIPGSNPGISSLVLDENGVVTHTNLITGYTGVTQIYVSDSGRFGGEPDGSNGFDVVCGSTNDYIKTHYIEGNEFNNVVLFFFDEAVARTYYESLTEESTEMEPCESAL